MIMTMNQILLALLAILDADLCSQSEEFETIIWKNVLFS